jgi:hypothetical protein
MAGPTFAFVVAGLCAGAFAHATEPRTAYRIICHPNNASDAVDRQFLEDVFLKKTTTWPRGGVTRPVDLEPESRVRRQFSLDVLRRPVDAVRSYWQQRIFSGRELPPPELERDEDVVSFVLKDPGAVGYVSADTALRGARVLTVR